MSLSELDALMDRAYDGVPSATGQWVTVDSALQTSAVWSCVQVIAETVASLPCKVYRQLPTGGKQANPQHRLYAILHDQPNPEMTAFEYWETAVTHCLTWGNHYGQIIRDTGGVQEIWPLDASRTRPKRLVTGELVYEMRRNDGTTRTFRFEEIFHIRGRSLDGVTGLAPISYARQTIGLALATEEHGARFFGNGSIPGGVLSTDEKLSPEAAKRLKTDWEALHSGGRNAHRVAVLEGGLKWTPVTIPNEDAQWLQTRRFTVEDIARFYRVPQHKIGVLERSTHNNIEQQNIEFVVDTIRPWLVRIEQAIQRDLFSITDGKRSHFAEFLVDALLRGDSMARAQALQIQRQNGVINADDWNEIENRNPLPNGMGKKYWMPANMLEVGASTKPSSGAPDSEDDPADLGGDTPGPDGKSQPDKAPADTMPTSPGMPRALGLNGYSKHLAFVP